jgi:AraC family transcriptional regulator
MESFESFSIYKNALSTTVPAQFSGLGPSGMRLTAKPPDWSSHVLPDHGLNARALTRVLAFVDAHVGDHFSIQLLANVACMSRYHFARSFRRSMGVSPMAYVAWCRINCAKQMLRGGDQKIADIAAALGFCGQSHLSRSFRRVTNLSFKQYLDYERPEAGA